MIGREEEQKRIYLAAIRANAAVLPALESSVTRALVSFSFCRISR